MLITVDYYKEIEGISSSDRDDRFELTIQGVSSIIETYLGYSITGNSGNTGVTELFDIQWNTYVVNLKYSPIIAILGVWERLARNEDYVQLGSEDSSPPAYDWYFDSVSDSIIRTDELGSYVNWPKGVGAVKVQYKAGFITVPNDIKLATVDLVNYYMKDEYKGKFTMGQTVVEGAQITKDAALPDHIKRVLDMYRI